MAGERGGARAGRGREVEVSGPFARGRLTRGEQVLYSAFPQRKDQLCPLCKRTRAFPPVGWGMANGNRFRTYKIHLCRLVSAKNRGDGSFKR